MSFTVLVSFLLTFIFVRIYVILGTIGIIDDPNLYIKGYHIHHLNYGIVTLAFAGILALFFQNKKNRLKIGAIYGIGLALTFDEFGMWLKLEDDYWTRLSYDAVVVISIILASMVYIPSFWYKIIRHMRSNVDRIKNVSKKENSKLRLKSRFGFLKNSLGLPKSVENLELSFLFQTIAVFLITSFLSLATANNMITGEVIYTSQPVQPIYVPPSPSPPYTPVQVGIFQFLVSFFLATLLMLIFLQLFKGKFLFEVFFSGAVIFGAQGPLGIILTKVNAFLVSIAIVILRFAYPRIWTQNIAVIIGVSGIAASLGLSVKPLMALSLLVVLSVYDIAAVYKTRHMVKLFKGMAEKGAVMALIIPKSISLWFNKFENITVENKDKYIFLGTGDLALPLFFATSAFPSGIKFSLLIVCGAVIGFIVNHIVFVSQKERKPIPALPAIAFFAIAGYVVATYL